MNPANLPDVMDIGQCAQYLGVSRDTLYLYAAAGTVPAFKLGNRWRFSKASIEKWIAEQSAKNLKGKSIDGN